MLDRRFAVREHVEKRSDGVAKQDNRMGHIDPTKEVFAQFKANDRAGPIHMLNLVRLRQQAAYPDGRKATGAEAYAAYGRESGPVFTRLGAAARLPGGVA